MYHSKCVLYAIASRGFPSGPPWVEYPMSGENVTDTPHIFEIVAGNSTEKFGHHVEQNHCNTQLWNVTTIGI